MNELADLVRSELRDLAGTGAPPPDLADRAVAAGIRRVRRRFAAAGGAVVAAAAAVVLAATQLAAPQAKPQPDPGPAAPEPRNVVFTKFKGTTVEVLNPATGEYRAVDVMLVMNASDDLRYASVLPQQAPAGPPDKRVGRLDTTTGEIRWYDAPVRWSAPPTISPDGRYLVVPIRSAAKDPDAGIVIVDTSDGSTRAFDLDADTADAINVFVGNVSFDRNPPDVRPRQFFDLPLSWHPDSRHVLVGNAIVDLTGRRTGTIPMPDAWLIAYRPTGDGLLVVPKKELNTYVLTDSTGTGTLDWTCADPSPVACPRLYFDGFLGWRGDTHILVKSPDSPGPGIDAIELATGKRTRVTTYDASRVLVAPADGLAPAVRDAVSF